MAYSPGRDINETAADGVMTAGHRHCATELEGHILAIEGGLLSR